MKRYLSAFSLTFFLYALCMGAFIYTLEPFKQLRVKPTNKMALNSISVIQQKAIVKQKKPKTKVKKKPKKVLKRKPKIIKPLKPKIVKVQKKTVKPIKVPSKIIPTKTVEKEEPKQQQKLVRKSLSKPYKQSYLQEHLERIIALIQKNMQYPKRAKRFNVQGEVLIEFVLHKNGEVKDFVTIKGHRLLKKSAIKAIKEASKQFPKVKKTLKLRVPIRYKLT